MKYLNLLLIPLFLLTACETRMLNTSQPLKIDIIGTDEAYCVLSTKYNRYELYAPGELRVERSMEDLKIDCTGSASRRRVVTLEPIMEELDLYYRYPEEVTIDFAAMDRGTRFNGYRAPQPETEQRVYNVITEDSFSAPVDTKQTYPVPRTYTMGRKSYPVSVD